MPNDAMPMQRFTRDQIEAFMARCFAAAGLPDEDAKTVGHLMAEADMLGKDSHGIFRLPGYIGRVKAGGFNPTPNMKVDREFAATALLDGDKFYKGLLSLIPNTYIEPGIFMLRKTIDMWGYYLRGLIVENLIMFFVSFLLLLILKVFVEISFIMALSIAVIIAVTNVVRIVGPALGACIGVILVLASLDVGAVEDVEAARRNLMQTSFGVLCIVAFVQLLDSVVILPLVMRDQVNIHPVICLLGIFLGGVIGGIVGMILAVPFIAGAKVIYRVLTVEMKRFDMHAGAVPSYLSTDIISSR